MRKPEFEHFRAGLISRAKSLPQQAREPYRANLVDTLDTSGLFLVQKARKDGHDDALVEVHCSWVGTDFSPDAVKAALRSLFPGTLFEGGQEMHWVESEEEIVNLDFAWDNGSGQFLTGRIKATV